MTNIFISLQWIRTECRLKHNQRLLYPDIFLGVWTCTWSLWALKSFIMINSFVNKSTKVVFPYSNFKSINIHVFALNQLALHSTTMDLLCRRGPLKFIFNIKYFLQFSVLPLQSFPGLIARIPVFHTENRGSNPAGGNKLLHFLPPF